MGLQQSGSDRAPDVQPGSAPPKLKFKRDPDGALKIDKPQGETHETVESAEKPPYPDDPRPARERDVPFPF
jgi:hypothetical protein